MKNAGFIRKNLISFIFCMILGIFVSSCGLEVVYIIQEPTITYNDPLCTSSDSLTWYFNFKTADSSQNEETKELSYSGTDIYYKIYNNSSNLLSQRNSILAVNTASNGSAAATRMIETYTYQQLGTSEKTENSVFFAGHDNEIVVLRLKNQNGSDNSEINYSQNACIGYKKNGESNYTYETYIPYRNSGEGTKSFDFFDCDEDNKNGNRDVEPVEGDADYYYSSTFSEENCYYVQLFSVARAWNTSTVSPVYSLVLDLGSVPIKKVE